MREIDAKCFLKLGARIKKLREKKGVDQKAFAFDCGIARTQMHHIEKGQVNMRILTLKKIADELEISLGELVTGLE